MMNGFYSDVTMMMVVMMMVCI